jgi:WD40 repeat protein
MRVPCDACVSSIVPTHMCIGHSARVLSVGWSTDGRILACGDAAGAIRLWDVSHPTHAPSNTLRITVGSLAAEPALVWALTFLPYVHNHRTTHKRLCVISPPVLALCLIQSNVNGEHPCGLLLNVNVTVMGIWSAWIPWAALNSGTLPLAP